MCIRGFCIFNIKYCKSGFKNQIKDVTLGETDRMKTTVLIVVGLVFAVFLLIRYLIKQNQIDQKEYEDLLNNDYPKPKDSDFNDKEDSY